MNTIIQESLPMPPDTVNDTIIHECLPMPPDTVNDVIQLLEALSRRAAELAAVLPQLDLAPDDLAALAGEVQRINARLADAEERLAFVGPESSLFFDQAFSA
jgi:hypothetical protein